MEWNLLAAPSADSTFLTRRAEIIPAQGRVRLAFTGKTYDWQLR